MVDRVKSFLSIQGQNATTNIWLTVRQLNSRAYNSYVVCDVPIFNICSLGI